MFNSEELEQIGGAAMERKTGRFFDDLCQEAAALALEKAATEMFERPAIGSRVGMLRRLAATYREEAR